MSAAPTSPVSICNLALARLGQQAISSIDTPSIPAEDTCALHYDMTRRKLLRGYVFNFSRKMAIWTKDSIVVPAFGFASAFKLPPDFIRLMALGDITILAGDTPSIFYEFSDGYIYTDSANAPAGGLQVQYVFDATDVTKFDSMFVDLFRLELAKDMSYAFTLKQSLIKTLDDELKDVRLAAAAIAGQEKPPRRVQRSRVRDVRRSGGIFRDNTRV